MFNGLESLDLQKIGGPQLAEVGKIKIGGKGKEIRTRTGAIMRVPEKFDRFIVTTNFRDPNTDNFVPDQGLMERIAKKTGQQADKLRVLPVKLLFNDPKLNFPLIFSCYVGNTAWCMGDGEKAMRLSPDSGDRFETKCPCERITNQYNGNQKCKLYGRLAVVLDTDRFGGCWVFRTTSWNSARNILSSMNLILRATGGILAGIPLELTVNPKSVLTANGVNTTVYVVNLEYPGSYEQLRQEGLKRHKEMAEFKVKLEKLEETIRRNLELPFEEEGITDKDIQEEFYPENLTEPVDTGPTIEDQNTPSDEAQQEQEEPQKDGEPETPPPEVIDSQIREDNFIEEELF